MTSTTYLDSLLYPIVSHLLEQRGRVEASEANDEPLRAIGYACCLVSRSFLPHGRRILYSHLDSRDSRDARLPNLFSFPRRIEHLVMHPHLAQFLRVCRFQIDGELEENAVALGELVIEPLCRATRASLADAQILSLARPAALLVFAFAVSQILNSKPYDPFADVDDDTPTVSTDEVEASKKNKEADVIHIRIQQRNGRKTITTLQGLPAEYDRKKLLKAFKKEFACNGSIVEDDTMGQVIQLQGDQRTKILGMLLEEGLKKEAIKLHGF
ncbi:hypothetical protein RQP46_010491 [Phenoliferia psychrophenolica]